SRQAVLARHTETRHFAFEAGAKEFRLALVEAADELLIQTRHLLNQEVVLGRRVVPFELPERVARPGLAVFEIDDLDRRDLALPKLVDDQIARDGEEVDAERGDSVVSRSRRILERAQKSLLNRVVEIERLREALEAKAARAAAKGEAMV